MFELAACFGIAHEVAREVSVLVVYIMLIANMSFNALPLEEIESFLLRKTGADFSNPDFSGNFMLAVVTKRNIRQMFSVVSHYTCNFIIMNIYINLAKFASRNCAVQT